MFSALRIPSLSIYRLGAALISCWLCAGAAAVELIAHRAIVDDHVENTIEAIAASWQAGAKSIELDVRVSLDGVAYLFHDADIDGVDLESLTFAQIQQLVRHHDIPILEDVLKIKHPTGRYLLDVKEDTVSRLAPIVDAVQRSEFSSSQLTFKSYRPAVLANLKDAFPNSRYFYLHKLKRRAPFFVAPSARRIAMRVAALGVDGVSLKGRRFIDAKYVSAFQNRGLQVLVWTINDPDRARFYADAGVDGIVTDRLSVLQNALSPPSEADPTRP